MDAQLLRNPKVRQNISRNAYHNKSLASEDTLLYSTLHLEIPGWSQALIAFTKSRGYKAFKPQQLAKIRQPTLILWGDNDKILGIKDVPKFQSVVPMSKLLWLDSCGDVPHLEQPQITVRRILSS